MSPRRAMGAQEILLAGAEWGRVYVEKVVQEWIAVSSRSGGKGRAARS